MVIVHSYVKLPEGNKNDVTVEAWKHLLSKIHHFSWFFMVCQDAEEYLKWLKCGWRLLHVPSGNLT